MERDIGDIFDRHSIAKLKFERIGTEETKKEYHAFNKEVQKIEKHKDVDWEQFEELMYQINSTIWSLEAAIKGDKEILPNCHHIDDPSNQKVLSHIGKNTILIRNINSFRVKVKNIINKLTKTGFQDIKMNHGSEL